ncbi:MAG: hypothetical protein LBC21_03770, partial [Oscillospiraceae bacterium]|nr:hypothetical protein [Oscillospiraceae bacterium]
MRSPLFISNAKVFATGSQLNRPDVEARLREAVSRPLVTVVAGAGYGKTQAVYSFLQECRAIKIWIQITEFDNFSEKFWENLTGAVAVHNEALAAKLNSIRFPESPRQYEQFFALIKREMSSEPKYMIILDDFHLINSKPILRFVERTAAERTGNICLILISRTQPDINVIGLLSKGLVSQINEEHLRFSRDDTGRYFKMKGFSLAPQALADIYSGTGGWVFAIMLIELSLDNGAWNKEYALSAMRSNVFRLIESEVFAPSSAELQKFLVKLSLIDHLSPALLLELCGDESLITQMRKISSFIRFDAYTGVYRIHHLFLEYLRLRQDMLSDGEKKDIYIRAARWCAQGGNNMDAIVYFDKAGDYGGIAQCAYPLTRMTPSRVAKFLLDIFDKMPADAYRENTELTIIKIKLLQNLALFDEAEALAKAAAAEYEALPRTADNCWFLSECYLHLGYIGIYTALHTDVRDHTHYFKLGHDYHMMSGRISKGPRERTLISSYVSRVKYPANRGDLQRGIDEFARYAGYAITVKNGMMQGVVELAECEAAYFQSDIKKAEALAYQAIASAHDAEQFQVENRALFFLLRINLHMGNPERLRSVLEQLEAQLSNMEYLGGYTLYDITCGWFYAHIRQLDRVADWLKNDFEKSELNTLLYGLEKLVQAKCFLVNKKYYAALAALEGQNGMYGLEAFLLGKLEVSVLRAVCKYNAGD